MNSITAQSYIVLKIKQLCVSFASGKADIKIVNTHEAKTKLSALFLEVAKNVEIICICRHGHPIADLVPLKPVNRLNPHPVMGRFTLDSDPRENLSCLPGRKNGLNSS